MQFSFVILLMVVAVIVVAIFMIRSQRNKNKQALRQHEAAIQHILQENNVSGETRNQLIYQNVFIDQSSGQLLVVDHRQARYHFSLIKLDEINSCKLKQIADTVSVEGAKGRTETITRQIGVEVVPRQKHIDLPVLVFYDVNRHNIYVKTDMENQAREFISNIMSLKKTALST
ncbi:hypothetical protein [Pollutibacter soli]|uniref:hypothetical protein n=1 Tax=Pollutibacter soli TaxID=3034157 RepID=UPI0030134D23